MKLAILTPSRGRPKELYRFFDSINKTMSGQNDILLYIGIDNDDPSKQDYYDVIHKMLKNKNNSLGILVLEEERRPLFKIWNDLVRLRSWEASADYFMMGGDDLIFNTQDWDIILDEKILSSDHPFYLYWFDDNIKGSEHSSFPIVSKHWVGVLGYFLPECFKYFYLDTWLFDIAKRTGVLKYIEEVKTTHLHFSASKDIPFDRTYQENRIGNVSAQDSIIFDKTENRREATSKILLERINQFKTK